MERADTIHVEVVYALPKEQSILTLDVPEGTTLAQAIIQSGILDRFPEIDLKVNKVGIFSKVCELDRALRTGDRVEIYRPLIADPKEIRRQRAAKGKQTRKGVAVAHNRQGIQRL